MVWYNKIYFGKLTCFFCVTGTTQLTTPFGMFIKEQTVDVDEDVSRARIRGAQQRGGFYLGYYVVWVVLALVYKFILKTTNPFDKEVEENCTDYSYWDERGVFDWTKFL